MCFPGLLVGGLIGHFGTPKNTATSSESKQSQNEGGNSAVENRESLFAMTSSEKIEENLR